MKISELKTAIDEGFAAVHVRFARVEERIAQFVEMRKENEALAAATWRHFDIVAEKARADVAFALEKAMANGAHIAQFASLNAAEHAGFVQALDNHEFRLTSLEKRGG